MRMKISSPHPNLGNEREIKENEFEFDQSLAPHESINYENKPPPRPPYVIPLELTLGQLAPLGEKVMNSPCVHTGTCSG